MPIRRGTISCAKLKNRKIQLACSVRMKLRHKHSEKTAPFGAVLFILGNGVRERYIIDIYAVRTICPMR